MTVCLLCNEEKPDEEFSVNTQRPNGLHFFCKACDEKNRVYLKWNPKVPTRPAQPDGQALNEMLVAAQRKVASELADKYLDVYRHLNPMYEEMQKALDDQHEAFLKL